MAAKVPRKKDALIRFFRTTMGNEAVKLNVRFQAAERLAEIYAKAEFYAERQAARQERAELRALGQPTPIPTETPEVEGPDAEARAKAFLESIGNGTTDGTN